MASNTKKLKNKAGILLDIGCGGNKQKGFVGMDKRKLKGVDIISIKGKQVELKVHGEIPALLKQLCQLPVEDMSFPEAALEDAFMDFYGREEK